MLCGRSRVWARMKCGYIHIKMELFISIIMKLDFIQKVEILFCFVYPMTCVLMVGMKQDNLFLCVRQIGKLILWIWRQEH